MFRRLTQVNQSRRTRQEYSWQPAGYSAEEILNKLDEGWFAGLQKVGAHVTLYTLVPASIPWLSDQSLLLPAPGTVAVIASESAA